MNEKEGREATRQARAADSDNCPASEVDEESLVEPMEEALVALRKSRKSEALWERDRVLLLQQFSLLVALAHTLWDST